MRRWCVCATSLMLKYFKVYFSLMCLIISPRIQQTYLLSKIKGTRETCYFRSFFTLRGTDKSQALKTVDMEWSHWGVHDDRAPTPQFLPEPTIPLFFFLQRMRSFTFPNYKLMLSLMDFRHVNILKYQPAYTMSMNGNECVLMDC